MIQRFLLLLSATLLVASAWAQSSKSIRLRTETIQTAPPSSVARAAVPDPAEPTVSGLYLLQFQSAPNPDLRTSLLAQGVDLLNFVPDDAYIARLQNVRLSQLRAQPGVRWVGPLEPRHKLDPRLTQQLSAQLAGTRPVKLLLAPGVSAPEIALLRRHLQKAQARVSFSLGTTYQGEVNAASLRVLAQSPAVIWIEPAPRMKLVDQVSTEIVAGEPNGLDGLAYVHELGFDGRGVTVSVADSGIDSGDVTFLHPDLDGRVEALFAYDNLADASDEHSHGTHCAGIVLGNGASGETDENGYRYGLGVAPGARLVGQRIFDGAGDYRPPPSYARLTQDAVRSGAYVGSNSWGDDTGGQYDLSAAEFDALVRDADPDFPGEQPYILEFSAGNAGPGGQTIGSPAVAKNVIATGATQNNRYEFPLYGEGQEVMADFSSRGPAADGRIKPDVVAPGTWIASLRSIFANDNNAWGPISDYYLYQGGTSQAGPHAAGAAAVIVQWYRQMHAGATPSPALVKAIMINSADDMSTAVIPDGGDVLGGEPDESGDGIVVGDTGPVPNNDEGWGRINLVNLIDSDRRFEFVEEGTGLASGQSFERKVIVGGGDQLKITLVYTDVPGLPAAIPALVNDLDLEVIAPNGDRYRGNAFAEGESTPGTPEGDRINNVEAVHLSEPAAGEWTVRVVGFNVVQDVHKRNLAAPEQDFAVVVSGQLPAPGEGVISWDRDAYQSPATATLRLVDAGLTVENSVTVRVRSTTEPAGLNVTLNRVGVSGTFLGTVGVIPGSAGAGDTSISANDGDELTAVYQDAAPAGERVATAAIDAQAPLISDVVATSEFGRTTVTWLTSEPATAFVWFGTTNAVTNVVSDLGLRGRHRLPFPLLNPGETFFYYVVSADAAGNTTTNDNAGRYFRFVAPKPANALLVYSPETLFAEGGLIPESPYPTIESWTDSLTALELDYEVWDVGAVGRAPTAAELLPYRVVLWRPEELQAPAPGLTAALTSYVNQGGSLFVSSFDLLSRLAETQALAFMTNVLHVASYQEDGGAFSLAAVPGDPVGGGKSIDLNYEAFPSGFIIDILGIIWEDGPDHLNAATNTATTYLQEDGRAVGVRYPRTGQDSTTGRVVFNSIALEAIPTETPAPNNRVAVLADALRFLAPDLVGGSSVAFDQSAYTVPGSAVVEVTDSARAGSNRLSVTLTVGTTTRTLDLPETVRRGIFRGRFTLVTPDTVLKPGRLPAQHGDVVSATYVDSANRSVQTEAIVDTQAPVISDVTAEASYNEAYILWTTDKPTDALVRFGESGGDDSFLTRTAYSAELATDHEVLIRGLLPNRTYYFQVLSRDAAGNLVRDNNDGEQYTVDTLTPLPAPWEDDLEEDQPGWTVYNDDGGTGASFPGDDDDDGGGDLRGTGWRWGVPENVAGVPAFSGENVWATNLKGDDIDFGISDLISPAIYLGGGNRATLRFWQYYDFSVAGGSEEDPFGDFVLEAAQVALSTDNGATWKDLYLVDGEVSADWEEVEVDLTKYLGSVVRLRFNYQLFAFNLSPRLGWLLDDIAIEMNSVPESALSVSNNLVQASFVLTGPTTVTGEGMTLRTNVPPGEYVITWQPVPHYTTPAPQTNVLAVGTPLTFTGRYTFSDANSNLISDAWETQHFGTVTPGYTGQADTDGDGVSDAVEWQTGTNPVEATSRLVLEEPSQMLDGRLRFEWNTATGREYAFETSNDLETWLPAATPVRATGTPLSVTLPALDPRLPFFFRVLVTP